MAATNEIIKEIQDSNKKHEIGADAKNIYLQQEGENLPPEHCSNLQDKIIRLNYSFNMPIESDKLSYALGEYSTALGEFSQAEGEASHAEGYSTSAKGIYSHTEGYGTTAKGEASHAEGRLTYANTNYSHAEGHNTIAGGERKISFIDFSHLQPFESAHAEGVCTWARGTASHAEGYLTTAHDFFSHAEGTNTLAKGKASHVEGEGNICYGYRDHVEGYNNISDRPSATHFNTANHVEGRYNTIAGECLHIEGEGHIITTKPIKTSFEEDNLLYVPFNGYLSLESAYSLEQPFNYDEKDYFYCTSNIKLSQIETPYIAMTGAVWSRSYGNIEGALLHNNGLYFQTAPPIAEIVNGFYANSIFIESAKLEKTAHIQGQYSKITNTNFAHVVGNGLHDSQRSNAHTLDWSGNAEFAGDVIAYGCDGSNPIKLSSLKELGSGSLIVREADSFNSSSFGDVILRAIKAGRQILIELVNKGQNNTHRLYSPVITYHLPKDKNSKLSLFYLPDQVDISGGLSSLFAEIQIPITETLFPN